jgi:hypothetical protein
MEETQMNNRIVVPAQSGWSLVVLSPDETTVVYLPIIAWEGELHEGHWTSVPVTFPPSHEVQEGRPYLVKTPDGVTWAPNRESFTERHHAVGYLKRAAHPKMTGAGSP